MLSPNAEMSPLLYPLHLFVVEPQSKIVCRSKDYLQISNHRGFFKTKSFLLVQIAQHIVATSVIIRFYVFDVTPRSHCCALDFEPPKSIKNQETQLDQVTPSSFQPTILREKMDRRGKDDIILVFDSFGCLRQRNTMRLEF